MEINLMFNKAKKQPAESFDDARLTGIVRENARSFFARYNDLNGKKKESHKRDSSAPD